MERGEPWTAERIAALRAALGLTQAGFAGELGVRQQTVSEWETGRYLPRGASARMLGMLAESRSAYGSEEQRAESGEREGGERRGKSGERGAERKERRAESGERENGERRAEERTGSGEQTSEERRA